MFNMLNTTTDFFSDHSIKFIEMALRTDRIERVEKPDGYGKRTGDCGDTVEFFINAEDNKITASSFLVNGCMNTIACCNTVAKLIQGRSIESAWKITPDKVDRFLETLPKDHYHCAELAVGALYLALSDLKT